jgi:hypothetical protein
MRKALAMFSTLLSHATLVSVGEWPERVLSAAGFSIGLLVIVILNQRFRRSNPQVSYACHVAAAMAVTFGVVTVITGVGHSIAVGSLALREREYGTLQVLRFTTGAMLVYSGAMNIGVYRAIRTGRRWAVAVGAATGLLFWLYLLFLFPLPGTGTARRLLGPWSAYLLWLGAAALTSRRGDAAQFSLDMHG